MRRGIRFWYRWWRLSPRIYARERARALTGFYSSQSINQPETKTALQEPRTIELSASDSCFERARKIWELMGFQDDRFGCRAVLAENIYHYMQLDAAAKKMKEHSNG